MPEVMASWLKLTRAPRIFGGADSPMYRGTTIDAEPTARPITKRAAISNPKLGENAARATPTTNSAAVASTVGRRPIRSATRPGDLRADHRPDEQEAGHELLVERRQAVKVLADEQQRPGDDPGVVAEQQAAEAP